MENCEALPVRGWLYRNAPSSRYIRLFGGVVTVVEGGDALAVKIMWCAQHPQLKSIQ